MTKTALLIGVSEYQPGLSPLPAATKDVTALKQVLEHPDIGGFQVISLTNPDPSSMQEAIETFFADRSKNDLVLLYFSGHGVKDRSGELFFATPKTRKSEKGDLIQSTAVPASFVHRMMELSRSKRQIVILDCCFSGAFARGMVPKDDGSVDIRSQLGGEGRVVLTSSDATQYSFTQESSDLSVYTHYLVEGLETGEADLNRDGTISIEDLFNYLKPKVRGVSPEMKPGFYPTQESYKMIVANAPTRDPVARYRREVHRLAMSREITFAPRTLVDRAKAWLSLPTHDDVRISPARREMLNQLQRNLGLSAFDAQKIEADTLADFRDHYRKVQAYERSLLHEMRQAKTLTPAAQRRLRDLQNTLQLSDTWVRHCEQKVAQRFSQSSWREPLQDLLYSKSVQWTAGILLFVTFAGLSAAVTRQFLPRQNQIPISSSQIQPQPPLPQPEPTNSFGVSSEPQPIPSPNSISDTAAQFKERWRTGDDLYREGQRHLEQSNQSAANNSFYRAIDEYDQAIELMKQGPTEDVNLYRRRARTYVALRKFDVAIADYNYALKLQPNNQTSARIYEELGRLYLVQRNPIEATNSFRESILLYDKIGEIGDANRVRGELQKIEPITEPIAPQIP